MMNKEEVKNKAIDIYYTGWGVVYEEDAQAVMEELNDKHNGTFYGDITMNGLVLIEKDTLV